MKKTDEFDNRIDVETDSGIDVNDNFELEYGLDIGPEIKSGRKIKKPKKMRKKNSIGKKILLTFIAAVFAISFLLPTILTFANSFMSEQEISSNYGVIFNDYSNKSDSTERTTTYRSKTVNLKLIPDKVVVS